MHDDRPERLSDRALLQSLSALVAQERMTTAALLAHLAEVDARRLYLRAGFSSMHAYCVEALRFTEAAAFRRIQAARTARAFPALLPAVADGRLHVTALCMLAPHLDAGNLDELVAVAARQSRPDLALWLAERFAPPRTPLPLEACVASPPEQAENAAPAAQVALDSSAAGQDPAQGAAGIAGRPPAAPSAGPATAELAPARVEPRPDAWPSAPLKSALRLEITTRTRDKLQRAAALLGHEFASGDLATVVDRALDALISQLERRAAAAAARARADAPRPDAPRSDAPQSDASRPGHADYAPRTVPARVKRAVWRRDEGRCTFIGDDGHRCSTRKRLEFDHVQPVARGGRSTVPGIRLLCRAHNQYEAERAFGAGFMRARRSHGQRRVPDARPTPVPQRTPEPRRSSEPQQTPEARGTPA